MDPDSKSDAMRLGVQAALMRELLHTPMWDCYREVVENMITEWTHRMRTGTKEEFDYRKGVLNGLFDALHVPENILTWSERANRN